MSLAQALSQYLNLNLLLTIGFLALACFSWGLKRLSKNFPAVEELRLHYFMIIFIVGLSLVHPFLPGQDVFKPAARVWSAQSLKTFSHDYNMADEGGYLSLAPVGVSSSMRAEQVQVVWFLVAGIVFIIGAIFLFKDLWVLLKIKRESYLLRKIGRVEIYAHQSITVPFSYWVPGQANVVVPLSLVEKDTDYKMALYHELQHHRHGDTRWVYAIWALRLLCPMNPFVFLWSRWISEIQEFACDETLVDQNKVESQAYARCLVEVAQTALQQKFEPVCATGLTFLVESQLLKRRIEKMFTQKTQKIGRSISASFVMLLIAVMTATAFASKSLVQDRRITIAQAQSYALRAQRGSAFPVVINDLVLKQLNRYIGTPEGREFIKNSLLRMENYKSMVLQKINQYNLPEELLAIPIVESGYQNLTQKQSAGFGAGLWQFIPSTARVFGLRVDNQVDQRLNEEMLTDVGMRYLGSNFLRFKDWQLAALAYNAGESAVQSWIEKAGTRNAWSLIRQGYENDQDYLARVMAAILILRNPEMVD